MKMVEVINWGSPETCRECDYTEVAAEARVLMMYVDGEKEREEECDVD